MLPATTPVRVLIADDNAEIRRVYAELLRRAGFEVETASNGVSALRAAVRRPPDVILLDILMPGLDGGAVAQRLKADERTREIPLIAVTGVPEWLQDHRHAAEAFAGVLFKPVRAEQLLATIRRVLGDTTRSRSAGE